jgi:phage shock protein A
MTNDKDELIKSLHDNIQRLKTLYAQEKEACSLLNNEKINLSKKLQAKEVEIQSLEVKLNTLKMAKTLSGSNSDMLDAKVKVNSMVREIDKCIALLNR